MALKKLHSSHTCPRPGCGRTLSRPHDVPRHIRDVHDGKKRPCPYPNCKYKGAKRQNKVSAHVYKHHSDTGVFWDIEPAGREQNEEGPSNHWFRSTQGGQLVTNNHYWHRNSPVPNTSQLSAPLSPTTSFAIDDQKVGIPQVGYAYAAVDRTIIYPDQIRPHIFPSESMPRRDLPLNQFRPWNRDLDPNVNNTDGPSDGNATGESRANQP